MGKSTIEGELQPGPRYQADTTYSARRLLSDVDGTILRIDYMGLPTPRITQAFRDSGRRLPTGLATGRRPIEFDYLAKHLELSGKSIISSGAQIFDANEGIIVERSLPVATVMDIARNLQADGIPHWILDNGLDMRWKPEQTAVSRSKEDLGQYWYPSDGLDQQKGITIDPSYIPTKPFVIVAHRLVKDKAVWVQDYATGDLVTASIAHEYPGIVPTYDVFIADSRANKAAAVREISEMDKIPLDEIMAIGDGHNDKELVGSAGIGVAVANGVEQLKNVATHLAPAYDHDGASVAIEHLLLRNRP